ncbi:MAG: hypothetical protein JWN03_2880 [Nocardia sp.]|uniref:hypothetical protein n=1 Tax=Nocardia sp. TaxID=1821 RepID=UPI002603F63A|nr:hypothetical protein [Nocardia sp.]MCU1642605.1 hypothetical protein [Nocardia sp.]
MTFSCRLDQAQIAVLEALDPGGVLAVDSLAKSAALTLWRTRSAVSKLSSRGLIMGRKRGGRGMWEITDRGRRTLSARGRYYR